MKIHVKNMVCRRCIIVVTEIFQKAGIINAVIQLGEIEIKKPIPERKLRQIEAELNKVGFEVTNNHTVQMIEQIKTITINYVYKNLQNSNTNYSVYLAEKLHHEYKYLSSLFSTCEGTTIEKYMIKLKIERVKELLVYDEKTLSEIAFEMGYSSVAHLSGQFKKTIGLTPTHFKHLKGGKRKSIDKI